MGVRCGMEGEKGIKSPMFLSVGEKEFTGGEADFPLSEGGCRKLEVWF